MKSRGVATFIHNGKEGKCMNRVEDFINGSKLNELLHCKEREETKNKVMWILAIIGAVAAVAAIAYAVYRYFTPNYLEDFEDDYDDFDDMFFADEDDAELAESIKESLDEAE